MNAKLKEAPGVIGSRLDGSDGCAQIPFCVFDSVEFMGLSHPARSLLIEIVRQYTGNNNGKLLTTGAYLATRGWKSQDVITRAKRELIASGLIYETAKGRPPNKASWYALSWELLDGRPDFDEGAVQAFVMMQDR